MFARSLPKLDSKIRIDGKIQEKEFSYNRIVLPVGNFTLSGFFQSERYFKHCEGIVREYFAPRPDIESKLKSKYADLLGGSCSVHVRRTDYKALQNLHPVLDIDYYRRAMAAIEQIESVDRFMVFSDDPVWCRENFGSDVVVVEGNQGIEDMFLMSMCSHHIIANSSFSWWGAWLNPNKNKVVISPSVWFGPDLKHHDTSDLIPIDWLKV